MSIIRAPRRESNFYVLDKQISEDKRLSWAARGLLVFLLGKPDHWTVNVRALINETKDTRKPVGRDGVYALIDELMQAGYVARSQSRNAAGVLGDISYLVSESPLPAAPLPAEPYPAEPCPANPTLVSNEGKQGLKKEQGLSGGERAQAPAPAPVFPKLDDLDLVAEQAQATRLAAEQAAATQREASEKALEASQAAEKAKAKAQVPDKAEKPAKTAVARAAEFPAGFTPNDACIELAASLGVTLGGVDGELARFEDYHTANGTTFRDWQAGLRTWIRNAAKFARRDQQAAAAHVSRAAPAAETAYQRSMRERVQEFAPSIARKAPAERQRQQSAAEFFNTIEVPARTVEAIK